MAVGAARAAASGRPVLASPAQVRRARMRAIMPPRRLMNNARSHSACARGPGAERRRLAARADLQRNARCPGANVGAPSMRAPRQNSLEPHSQPDAPVRRAEAPAGGAAAFLCTVDVPDAAGAPTGCGPLRQLAGRPAAYYGMIIEPPPRPARRPPAPASPAAPAPPRRTGAQPACRSRRSPPRPLRRPPSPWTSCSCPPRWRPGQR
jgi:hypothetical protein